MPTLPSRSPEQRAQASARAAANRAVRAQLRCDLVAGRLTLADAFALTPGGGTPGGGAQGGGAQGGGAQGGGANTPDPRAEAVGAMRVRVLLESLPGVGERTAEHTMVAAGIGPDRRVRGLGRVQRAALLDRLGPPPAGGTAGSAG